MEVRIARPEDAAALVRIHADASAHFADLDPVRFQRPDLDGFAAHLEADLRENDDAALNLVAELDGTVIAVLFGRLISPPEGAGFAYPRDVARTRLEIEYLATAAAHRRTGAGLRLVQAAEAWGRERGATVAEASTYHGSPLSMPFWTRRAGYEPRSVNLRKDL
jgi:GNAT superfamily N-acetyltransferase